MTKLYDAPRNSWVRVIGESSAPPAARVADPSERIKFYHVDGMYSYCKDVHGNMIHLPAWQEVEVLDELG